MYFKGCCTYPRGGYVFSALLLSTAAALACNAYAAGSCRFAVIQFTATSNGFEDSFSARPVDTNLVTQYRAAVGLFQWLRPRTFDVGFTEGSCAGYQDSMLQAISEPYFDTARGAAVVAFLLNALAFLWVWTTACMEYRSFQTILLFLVCIVGSVTTGLTFLFPFQSELCKGSILTSSICHIDQAGLVMAAASLFGMVSAVTVFTYVLDHDVFLPAQPRQKRRRRIPVDFEDSEDMEVSSIPKRILFPTVASSSPSISSGNGRSRRRIDDVLFTIDHSQPTEMEVYIKNRLDEIERELADV